MTYDVISNFNSSFRDARPQRAAGTPSTTPSVPVDPRSRDQGNWLHDLRVAYLPRKFYNTESRRGRSAAGARRANCGRRWRRASTSRRSRTSAAATLAGHVHQAGAGGRTRRSIFKNKHSFKFGADAMGVHFLYIRYQGPQSGTYAFSNMANYLAGRYTTYTQSFGPAGLARNHTYLSAYAQDSWAANNRLTVNYGLRWDGDDITAYQGQDYGNSWKNFGPRLAVSYDLTGQGHDAAEGRNGTDVRPPLGKPDHADLLQQQVRGPADSATWNFGQAGAPVYPNTIPATSLPSNAPVGVRNVYITPDPLKHARDVAVHRHSGSRVRRQLLDQRERGRDAFVEQGEPVRHQPGVGEPGESGRPLLLHARGPELPSDPAVSVPAASASYAGVVVSAQRRDRHGGVRFGGNMTMARAYDQGENYSTQPNDIRYFSADYGPSGDVPTFTATVNGSEDITKASSSHGCSTCGAASESIRRAGRRRTRTATARSTTALPGWCVTRSRARWTNSLDLRLTWNAAASPSGKLQLTLEAFNIYNKENWQSLNTLYGPVARQPEPGIRHAAQLLPAAPGAAGRAITVSEEDR